MAEGGESGEGVVMGGVAVEGEGELVEAPVAPDFRVGYVEESDAVSDEAAESTIVLKAVSIIAAWVA